MRLFVIFCVLVYPPALVFSQAQTPKDSGPQAPQNGDQAPSVNPDLADAEASIATSDWKTASVKLDTYLASHANDARALFDAGYVADHQDQLDRAAGFYRSAIEANPNSFESRIICSASFSSTCIPLPQLLFTSKGYCGSFHVRGFPSTFRTHGRS